MPENHTSKTVDYDYVLPPELIAQHPADRRDGARMMVLHRVRQHIEHRRFADLPDYLRAGDLVVVNNTKVIPARLFAHKPGTGGRAEIFLLEQNQDGTWLALLRCRRRPDPGQHLELEGAGGRADILSNGAEGQVVLRFTTRVPFLDYLAAHGHVPLPPYIKRESEEKADQDRYQTIYAQAPGAVAAPTAGLHFNTEMFARLEALGVSRAELTLHVGIGTFRPVKAERVQDHVMHEERFEISAGAAESVQAARARGGRILAVGSTSVRTLESVARDHGSVVAASGRTGIFIYPPYTFRAVDLMLTNFHLPQSTLLMMVCALAGHDFVMHAYAEAVREKYRFFSYGDCMLIV